MSAVGRLSPDRSTIFDVSQWPTEAVVYDAEIGRQAAIDTPWVHFTLVGWSDEDTFYGVAERIDEARQQRAARTAGRHLRAADPRVHSGQPVSPTEDDDQGQVPTFLVEDSGYQL